MSLLVVLRLFLRSEEEDLSKMWIELSTKINELEDILMDDETYDNGKKILQHFKKHKAWKNGKNQDILTDLMK